MFTTATLAWEEWRAGRYERPSHTSRRGNALLHPVRPIVEFGFLRSTVRSAAAIPAETAALCPCSSGERGAGAGVGGSVETEAGRGTTGYWCAGGGSAAAVSVTTKADRWLGRFVHACVSAQRAVCGRKGESSGCPARHPRRPCSCSLRLLETASPVRNETRSKRVRFKVIST